MTEQRLPMRLAPSSLVVARRALVMAVAALAVAVAALAVVLWGDLDSDPAESEAAGQAETDAAAALAEAQTAVAMAEVAAADAAAAENALAAALAAADGAVSPEVVARLEAEMEQARAEAAAALAAANAAVSIDRTPDEDATAEPEEEAAAENEPVPEPEEAPAVEDEAAAEPAPEPEDTDPGEAAPLPGEPFDLGPSEGAGLAVVGIRSDSALNVRDVPNGTVVARLDNVMDGVRDPAVYVRAPNTDDLITTVALNDGVVATGNTRQLATTIWHEFRVGDLTGWSSAAYLAQVGATDDATAEVVEALGELPAADTMLDLGLAVARTMTSQEPPSRVVVSEVPVIFEALAQMTIDVVGIGDDSVLGYRLTVFAQPADEDWTQDDPGPFALKSVERTLLCHSHRGVSEEGLCN